tara:strand:- start:308 stop:568 length:261 start_codon:yes stop_codon:yes gene_type:complete
MSKILKFPEINGPDSKKEFELLAKLMKEVNEREEESYKATIKFLQKLKSISNHVGPLSKKEINEMIKDYKNYYKNKLDEIKEILQK